MTDMDEKSEPDNVCRFGDSWFAQVWKLYGTISVTSKGQKNSDVVRYGITMDEANPVTEGLDVGSDESHGCRQFYGQLCATMDKHDLDGPLSLQRMSQDEVPSVLLRIK